MTEPDNPYAAPLTTAPVPLDRASPNDRSMFAQILVVGILQTVVGGVELLVGGMYVVAAGVIFVATQANNSISPNEPFPTWVLQLIYGGIGGAAIVSGGMRLASGIGSFYFRYRRLMLVSLIFGLVSMFTCYCALTAVPLAIYGMIIMCSPAAKRAYAMRKAGQPPVEIRRVLGS